MAAAAPSYAGWWFSEPGRLRPLPSAPLEGLLDLAVLGMTFRGLLGEDEVAVDLHFEHPAPGGDQGQLGDGAGVVRQELGRQTDGPVRVVSDHAVFNADLHGSPFQAGQVSMGTRTGAHSMVPIELGPSAPVPCRVF